MGFNSAFKGLNISTFTLQREFVYLRTRSGYLLIPYEITGVCNRNGVCFSVPHELNKCYLIQVDFVVERIHVWRLFMCWMLQCRKI